MSALPFVSIIVPAYNEAMHLRECLPSLLNQDYPNYEVVLVDNASTDETREICTSLPAIRYIYYDKTKSSYGARNAGVRSSNAEAVAFFDADQTACPTFLTQLLSGYAAGEPHHIYVGQLEDDIRVPRVLREYFSAQQNRRPGERNSITTSCVAIPRALFDELGGFKEELLSGGDFEFFNRALRKCIVHKADQPCGYHYHSCKLAEFLLREERYGFGSCLRAKAEGRVPPSVLGGGAALLGMAATKLIAAALVPFRYPPSSWGIRWQAQGLHWCSALYQLRGTARHRLGAKRAGDLPLDASAYAAPGPQTAGTSER